MRHLGVEKAHIVGHSIGGCVALQLARDAPGAVVSLALLEPPVLNAVTDRAGARVIGESAQLWQRGDTAGALHLFMTGVVDPDYQMFFKDVWPAGAEELVHGGKPFFETDQPSVQAWRFDAANAARITQPALLVIGDGSDRVNPIRSQVQHALMEWLPNAEAFTLPDSTHLLPLQNPSGLASALVDFWVRIDA
jgi:pimeloyl-ACP methyl ester carboxylesterase